MGLGEPFGSGHEDSVPWSLRSDMRCERPVPPGFRPLNTRPPGGVVSYLRVESPCSSGATRTGTGTHPVKETGWKELGSSTEERLEPLGSGSPTVGTPYPPISRRTLSTTEDPRTRGIRWRTRTCGGRSAPVGWSPSSPPVHLGHPSKCTVSRSAGRAPDLPTGGKERTDRSRRSDWRVLRRGKRDQWRRGQDWRHG